MRRITILWTISLLGHIIILHILYLPKLRYLWKSWCSILFLALLPVKFNDFFIYDHFLLYWWYAINILIWCNGICIMRPTVFCLYFVFISFCNLYFSRHGVHIICVFTSINDSGAKVVLFTHILPAVMI